MKCFYPFLITLLVLTACTTNSRPKQTLLTAANLKSSFISLFSDSSYTLKTPKGAIIKIAAGSFKVSRNSRLQLEIKEAYTLQDILLAGLATESNGKPLQSAGMIYINATDNGKAVELLQPIKISIPTTTYDDKMQLFKGEIEADSSINWIDPQPLDTGATAKKIALGMTLFKANCASCHKPTKDFVGPALAFCREREPDKEWVYQFMRNTSLMVEKDPYARTLKKKYASAMTSFPALRRADVAAILDFCDNEAALNPFPVANNTIPLSPAADSAKKIPCGYDTVYYAKPETAITILTDIDSSQQLSIPENDNEQDTAVLRQNNNTRPRAPLDFTYNSSTGGMYDIAVNAFGWYNIDAFIELYPNAANVVMKVKLQIPVEAGMNVFLLCPEKKLLTEAIKNDNTSFIFEKENGTFPLFIGDKAVLLTFGSKNEKMFYGTVSFKIQKEQTINIQVKETTEAELKSFILQNNIDGIKIDLDKKEDFKIQEKPCDEIYVLESRKK